jgi:NADPH:quinone reductase
MDLQVTMAATGGADVLTVSDQIPLEPGPQEIRVRHHAIGVNFVDIYHRSGLYPLPCLPAIIGVEGAGIVEAVGQTVENVKTGDRIVYAGLPVGAYASTRLLPAWRAIVLPDNIPFELAAASMLRGLTVEMLLKHVLALKAGSSILVHAAAGGLGQYVTCWAKFAGIHVIGTASSEAKAGIANAAGADQVIVGRDADHVAAVMAFTEGHGVDAVIDGVGGANFLTNFQMVRPFGMVASMGQAGGPIAPVPISALSQRSASLSRPSIIAHIADPASYRAGAKAVLEMMDKGIAASVGPTYPLAEARQAHLDMETGKSTGSPLLIP